MFLVKMSKIGMYVSGHKRVLVISKESFVFDFISLRLEVETCAPGLAFFNKYLVGFPINCDAGVSHLIS